MAASDPSPRRSVPVRLSEVPLELRLKAARELCRHAKTDRERAELINAALAPSAATFYVTDAELLRAAA